MKTLPAGKGGGKSVYILYGDVLAEERIPLYRRASVFQECERGKDGFSPGLGSGWWSMCCLYIHVLRRLRRDSI